MSTSKQGSVEAIVPSSIKKEFSPETGPPLQQLDVAAQVPSSGENEIESRIRKNLKDQQQDTSTPVAYPKHQKINDNNIIVLVKTDHQMVRDLYKYYQHVTDTQERAKVHNTITRELVQHDECEQAVMYPLLKEAGELGKKHFERSLKEHQELREELFSIRKTEQDTKFQDAIVDAFTHMEQEETRVLPLLREYYSEKVLEETGVKYKRYKPMFATRPHPDAPQEGIGAALGNIMIHPFDKLRDFMEEKE